ncbi:MAG: hypothetical protein ACLQKH_17975 [Steroidobacteraceae bacterium]
MNAKERQGLIDLRVELGRRVRLCAGCRGSGRMPASNRPCPLCRGARRAIESTEELLLPSLESLRA